MEEREFLVEYCPRWCHVEAVDDILRYEWHQYVDGTWSMDIHYDRLLQFLCHWFHRHWIFDHYEDIYPYMYNWNNATWAIVEARNSKAAIDKVLGYLRDEWVILKEPVGLKKKGEISNDDNSD